MSPSSPLPLTGGILEEALTALLPPVPVLLAPPLPPRPDVVMDPPVVRESPEPAPDSQGKMRDPNPERGHFTHPPAPVQASLQTPSPVIIPAAPTVTSPLRGNPPQKRGQQHPHSAQKLRETARKSVHHRSPHRSDFCGREFHLPADFCSNGHRPPGRQTRVPRPSTPLGEYSPPPPRCFCPTWEGARDLHLQAKNRHRHHP